MKNFIIFSMILLATSCGSQKSEDKQAELQKYRELAQEYSKKIETLEKEIASSTVETKEDQLKSVRTLHVLPKEFSSFFTATGTVEAVEDVFISPEVSGQISAIPVKRGDQVKKGDLLIRLNTDIIQRNIEEIRTSLELAKKVFEKQEQLWEKNIGSELQYLEAKNGKQSLEARLATLQSQLDLSYIRAPFDGIIDDIMVKTGEMASPGMRLVRLVNLSEMRIIARVSESFLSSIKRGDSVELGFPSYPELSIQSSIARIGTVIDPVTRTFPVEVFVGNPGSLLKPNMISSVRIREYSDPGALTVPSIILKQDFNGTFLFRVRSNGATEVAEKVYVQTGRTVQDITKISEGINEGDRVIIAGYNIVSDGEAVSVIN
jgi:membrane fusion protein, multidrug efflux system